MRGGGKRGREREREREEREKEREGRVKKIKSAYVGRR